MTIETFLDGRVTMMIGDVMEQLRLLPSDSVECALSSPPYWGLRSYLADDHPDKAKEIGLERSLGEHLRVMVGVFEEVRRILKPDGVCWINYGDCYATAPNGRSAADTKALANDDRTFRDKPFSTIGPIYDPSYATERGKFKRNSHRATHHDHGGRVVAGGYLKPKDLAMIPQRLFIALQDAGWYVRSVLPWVKRNGMPESISDRPANSLEYVAMLTKSERYRYDAKAVRVRASQNTNARVAAKKVPANWDTTSGDGGHGKINRRGRNNGVTPKSADHDAARFGRPRANDSWHAATSGEVLNDRNFRNTDLFFSTMDDEAVGLVSDANGTPLALDVLTEAFTEAHYATFPQALVEPLIKAGCPAGSTVLDCFGGAGTTAMVAAAHGRNTILVELNPESAVMARARIEGAFTMGPNEAQRHMVKQMGRMKADAGPLFGTMEAAKS